MKDRADRVAVITGGGGDMGLACARQLGKDYRLILAELDEERLERALAAIREDGIAAIGERLDVTNSASLRALAERTRSEGELGALVHTAGLSPTMAAGPRIWDVNLVGSAHLMEAFRPLVTTGSVAVLVASQAGHFGRALATPELTALLKDPLTPDLVDRARDIDPDFGTPDRAYMGSKYGVLLLAVRESVAWGAEGGRVVSLSPGIIDTGMGRREYDQQAQMKHMLGRTPLGRMGRAEEIAATVAFLCSEAASYITGTDLLVDGGSTAQLLAGVDGS